MKRSLNTAKMNVRVGIMSLISFLILVWVLFFPVRGISPFKSKVRVTGYYDRVDGLKRNAPVYFRGIEVGSVDSVTVQTDHPETPLRVIVGVEEDVVPLLPKGTTMEIVARGLLGDVFVDMVPPAGVAPEQANVATIQDGDVLMTKDYSSALDNMSGLSDSIKSAVEELRTMLARANEGDGSLGHLVRDDSLYNELVTTVKEIGRVSDNIEKLEDTINQKLLDEKTKQGVDNAVATANRVLDNADKLTKKADELKWYLGVGADKYLGSSLTSSYAQLTIVPNKDKFYQGGIDFFKNQSPVGPADYSSDLGGYLGYDGFLGLRILDSPIFFRGGMKRTSVDAGLDFRLSELVSVLPVEINADLSKFSQPTAELDLNGSLTLFKSIRLEGGADDVMNTPFWRIGISLIYDDEDLTTIFIKSRM
jgi:phospholipid/cholesterol/gamma-HCH transport system substrate-binding protein